MSAFSRVVLALFFVLIFLLGFFCWLGSPHADESFCGFLAMLVGALGILLCDIAFGIWRLVQHNEMTIREKAEAAINHQKQVQAQNLLKRSEEKREEKRVQNFLNGKKPPESSPVKAQEASDFDEIISDEIKAPPVHFS